jgi:hypothetical protein
MHLFIILAYYLDILLGQSQFDTNLKSLKGFEKKIYDFSMVVESFHFENKVADKFGNFQSTTIDALSLDV